MPILMPDTSEMEDLRPSKPGTYKAKIVKVDAQKSKEKQKDMIVPTFQFEAEPLEGGEVRKVNRRTFLMISGAGAFGFDQILRATGNGGLADQIKQNPGRVPFDSDVLLNKDVQVTLTTDLYQGAQQDKISGYLPV